MRTELRHQLQTGTWTYPQQSNNVWVVQTAHGQHMLCREILHASFYICKQTFSLAAFKMFQVLIPTSVISVKVCRPELSWILLMATGIFTVSPSGIQNPLNRQNCNHTNYLHWMTGMCKRKFNKYLADCTKNSWAQWFDFPQLWGLQYAGVNFGSFLSRPQWLKALPIIHFPDEKESRSNSWGRVCPRPHLSTLQIPPHGSLAANG